MAKRVILVAILVGIFICQGLAVYLSIYYINNASSQPQIELKKTYQWSFLGNVSYLTKEEKTLLLWLFYGGASLMLFAGIFNYLFHPFNKSKAGKENI